MSRTFDFRILAESTWISYLLWDIDCEFQNAHEACEQWLVRTQRKQRRTTFKCMSGSSKEDPLLKALHFGSDVQKLILDGQRRFGEKFEKGDSICQNTLSAQLLRIQHEVCLPLLDSLQSRRAAPLAYDAVLRAARGVRWACLMALQDQIARLSVRHSVPVLPPPRFRVEFCPLALQLQMDQINGFKSNIGVQRACPQDPNDDREVCPFCNARISVSAHSGLPEYRRILYQSHIRIPRETKEKRAAFACTSCYKTFDDSYALLEHAFQRDIGSELSCLKKRSYVFKDSGSRVETLLVEQCLKNCLEREMQRKAGADKSKEVVNIKNI